MSVVLPDVLKKISLFCVVTSLGTASAAGANADEQIKAGISTDAGLSNCLTIPEQTVDFGNIEVQNIADWVDLEKWQFMTNISYLAVGQDESGLAYLRQKLEPTSQGSVHVVGKGVLTPSRTYTLSQSFFLEPGFDWGGENEGGKLGFGLGGGSTPTGGMLAQDGFSARLMWRGNNDGTAQLAVYAYSSDRTQNLPYGDDYPLQDFQVPVGEWFTIIMEITANSSTGASDGRARVWADNVLKLQRENIHWQSKGAEPTVDNLMYATFHGGNSSQWAPSQTVYARFGNVCWQPEAYTPSDILPKEDSALSVVSCL